MKSAEDDARSSAQRTVGREDDVAAKISRRKFLATTGGIAAITQVAKPALAQQKPVKVGLMTVKTGGLAAGGAQRRA